MCKFIQWNIRKSIKRLNALMQEVEDCSVIFIQEQPKDYEHPLIVNDNWLIYNPPFMDKQPRVCTLIKPSFNSQYQWIQVYPSSYFQTCRDIIFLYSSTLDLYLINIYNDSTNDTLIHLCDLLRSTQSRAVSITYGDERNSLHIPRKNCVAKCPLFPTCHL